MTVPDESDQPPPKPLRRRARMPEDPFDEAPFDDSSPLSPSEAKQAERVLRHFRPEVGEVYHLEADARYKRQMIHFLSSIKRDVLNFISGRDELPQVLAWLRDFEPVWWARLGYNLPANPNVIGRERNFKGWARWLLSDVPHRGVVAVPASVGTEMTLQPHPESSQPDAAERSESHGVPAPAPLVGTHEEAPEPIAGTHEDAPAPVGEVHEEAKARERRMSADRLRAAREARGMTQKEAARLLGVGQSRISEWERGARVPTWIRLVEVAAKLGYDPRLLAPELFGASSPAAPEGSGAMEEEKNSRGNI